jgi:hypothetical protein
MLQILGKADLKLEYFSEGEWDEININLLGDGREEATRYGYRAIDVCRYQAFFITKSGRFGLRYAQLAPGFSLCLIHGLLSHAR